MHSRRALGSAALFCLLAAGCQCQPPQKADGGGGDSGAPFDSGTDAAVADAGVTDGGDGGNGEAGQPDAGGADGGPADAGSIDGGAPDAGLAFCDAYLAAFCGWFSRCGQLDPAQAADCAALSRWGCHQPQLDAVLDAGKVSFAATRFGLCLQQLTASSCARSFPGAPECDGLFAPATAVGGLCTRQWSTFCAGGYCRGTACPAQCESFLALDAGCSGEEGDQCGPAAWCSPGPPRVCTALLATGDPCTQADRCGGGTCDTSQARCLAYRSQPADAGCGSDSVCQAGLYCKAAWCSPSEPVGGPCRLYGGDDCQAALTCRISDGGTTGFCQPRSGPDGGCFGLTTDCEPGLSCDSPSLLAPGTCLRLGSEGEPCVHVLQNCKVGLLCDQGTARCRRLPRVGEPCVRDPGNFRSSDCVGGFCPPATDAGARCTAPQAAGASCERPWECASTECASGSCSALCTSF